MPRSLSPEELRARFDQERAQLKAANDKVTARAGRNLVFAAGTGVVFGGLFALALFAWEPLILGFALLLGVLCSIELATAMRGFGLRVPRWGIAVATAGILIAAWFYGAMGSMWGLFASSVVLTGWRTFEGLHPKYRATLRDLSRDVFTGLFVLGYVAFPLAMALVLRKAEHGEWWVFTVILVVICVDIGAYAAGVTLGKHKMAPRVSPNKTWEGFGGAALAALIAAMLAAIFLLDQPWWVGVVIGGVVLVTATVGDLAESLIKRNLGIKDMSGFLPGHGGLLDRLDSVLPSLVGVYGIALLLGAIS